MKILLLIILLVQPLQTKNEDFKLSLKYYSRPIVNLEWEILIYRKKNKAFIQSNNFMNQRFHIEMDYDKYKELLIKLNKLNIWNNISQYPKKSKNGFYIVEIKNKNQNNYFKFEAGINLHGRYNKYTRIIRLIKNYTKLEIPDN
jgi:hypothetical protein